MNFQGKPIFSIYSKTALKCQVSMNYSLTKLHIERNIATKITKSFKKYICVHIVVYENPIISAVSKMIKWHKQNINQLWAVNKKCYPERQVNS